MPLKELCGAMLESVKLESMWSGIWICECLPSAFPLQISWLSYTLYIFMDIYICAMHIVATSTKKNIKMQIQNLCPHYRLMSCLHDDRLPCVFMLVIPVHSICVRGNKEVVAMPQSQRIKVYYVSTHSHKCTGIMIKHFTNKMAHCVVLFAK